MSTALRLLPDRLRPRGVSSVRRLSRSAPLARPKVYAVKKGRQTGVFETWSETQQQVDGYAGAAFKSFGDLISARAWLDGEVYKGPSSDAHTTYAFVDGSCSSAGRGGIGIHWEGLVDMPDVAERVPGISTNNRAELFAIIRTMELDKYPHRRLVISSDSEYSINALTTYHKTSVNKDFRGVMNADLIAYAGLLMQRRPGKVELVKVAGHRGVFNNEVVDRLARTGADFPELPDREFESEYRLLLRDGRVQVKRTGQTAKS